MCVRACVCGEGGGGGRGVLCLLYTSCTFKREGEPKMKTLQLVAKNAPIPVVKVPG